MKIGIMGGTFNPIHYGHLFLAENAYEQVQLDHILFMPSNHPPHKKDVQIMSSNDRVTMVKLAIEDNPHFLLSELEVHREGMTYTVDTLTEMTREQAEDEFYFIVGADSLINMPKWKNPLEVFKLCTIIAANREAMNRERLELQVEYLKKEYGARIILIDIPTIDISSRHIRERIQYGQSIRYYVPEKVAEYIKKQGLFLA